MSIFNVFARSPLSSLQTHMNTVNDCAQLLNPFFDAVFKANWEEAANLQMKITEQEHKADDLKGELRLSLPNSLFLPVSRIDLLELSIEQDHIANKAKDIAGLVFGRKMQIPESFAKQFKTYLSCALSASNQAKGAINELDKLLETGFRGLEAEFVKEMINKLNAQEHENDELQVCVRDSLFQLEADLKPVDVMFLYKVIDWIGDLADKAENVGGRLQLLLAR